MSADKKFYIVYWDYYDDFIDAENDLPDNEFKDIAEDQTHVYSLEELCELWNAGELPYQDSFIRYL